MVKEKFLMLSLKDTQSKKLAQVLSNDTSRQILDYLAEDEATESELAKILHLPLSTVHYNLQALVDGGLVVCDEFHYSEKGKEIMHYKLANKYIIIAPKTTFGIKEKLKSILPAVLIIGVVALVIQFFLKITTKGTFTSTLSEVSREKTTEALQDTAAEAPQAVRAGIEGAVETSKSVVGSGAEEAMDQVVANATEVVNGTQDVIVNNIVVGLEPMQIAIWFGVGALFGLVLYIFIDWLRKQK
ncbi:ArsR/SmtB family transcription factor [Nanoarchaeota archaeon]